MIGEVGEVYATIASCRTCYEESIAIERRERALDDIRATEGEKKALNLLVDAGFYQAIATHHLARGLAKRDAIQHLLGMEKMVHSTYPHQSVLFRERKQEIVNALFKKCQWCEYKSPGIIQIADIEDVIKLFEKAESEKSGGQK